MHTEEGSHLHAGAQPEIFRFAALLRANMTEEENVLWEFLKQKPKGFKFRRQHPFHVYVLDFYCHKAKLSIEVDGKFHDHPDQKRLDDRRTDDLQKRGITEIRFSNEEIRANLDKVLSIIYSHLPE